MHTQISNKNSALFETLVTNRLRGRFARRYDEANCRISSDLKPMANSGHNPLVPIQISLAGHAVENIGE